MGLSRQHGAPEVLLGFVGCRIVQDGWVLGNLGWGDVERLKRCLRNPRVGVSVGLLGNNAQRRTLVVRQGSLDE